MAAAAFQGVRAELGSATQALMEACSQQRTSALVSHTNIQHMKLLLCIMEDSPTLHLHPGELCPLLPLSSDSLVLPVVGLYVFAIYIYKMCMPCMSVSKVKVHFASALHPAFQIEVRNLSGEYILPH